MRDSDIYVDQLLEEADRAIKKKETEKKKRLCDLAEIEQSIRASWGKEKMLSSATRTRLISMAIRRA